MNSAEQPGPKITAPLVFALAVTLMATVVVLWIVNTVVDWATDDHWSFKSFPGFVCLLVLWEICNRRFPVMKREMNRALATRPIETKVLLVASFVMFVVLLAWV